MIPRNAREQETQENRWLTGNGKPEMLQKKSENSGKEKGDCDADLSTQIKMIKP